MTSFDERQKGYENKFAHDQELEFKVRSKRNKLIARWAAEKMHMDENEISAYVSQVIEAAVDGVPNETVLAKIVADLGDKGVSVAEEEVKEEMERLLLVAREEFQ